MDYSANAQSASNGFWQAQSIYQVITDRFFDGDPSNNNADGNYSATGTTAVHGGDFKGLEQKLDYIKALGATAIWISPVVQNANGEFHGYAGRNFYQVAPHWGSLADLQHFTQAAHARGLLVIDDIICNHGGDLISSGDSGYCGFPGPPSGYKLRYSGSKTYPSPFDLYNSTYNSSNNALTNLFHNYGCIGNYSDTTQVQLGELSGLDDFRTESPYVRSNLAAIYQYWIEQAGFDAFRIDTTKHVEMSFWQYWCPLVHQFAATNSAKSNFFMFGEVYDGNESLCGSYTGTKAGGAFAMDSVVDYPLYFIVNNVFKSANGPTSQIEDHYSNVSTYYDTNAQMRLVTFLDNHDQPRFLNTSTTNRLAIALAFLYTSRGVPCLYYGTEQGFNGATDPYDREDMFAGQFKDTGQAGVDSFNMTHPLFQLVAKLNNFRRLYPSLSLGSHINQWNNGSGSGLFAYSRQLGTQEVFVVFNTSSSTQVLPNRPVTYAPGTALVNLLDNTEIISVTGTSQTPLISVPSTTAKMFIAQSQQLPLDPAIMSNSPAHGAANVRTWSAISLQFSKPMDTNSVQAVFSVSPVVNGSFSWSLANDTLTFTPGVAGLAGMSNITVRVTNSALDSVSGNKLFAPYELKFATAAFSVHDTTPPAIYIQAPSNGAVISGNLVISGTATDNFALAKTEVQLDNGAWLAANGTNPWNLTLNSSNFLNGPHLISARATDANGNISATNTRSANFLNVPGGYVQRVSGGNPANVSDCSANIWLADLAYGFGSFGFSGGTTGYVASSISGVCSGAQPLYQRERYSTSGGGFLYQFDCPEGIYETTLLEAETYWSGVGKRVFNVFIQGEQVLTNFDIYAASGGQNIPISRVFTNAVTNSQLQILFLPVVDNARISGLQVRKIADVFSDTDGVPDWWRLAYFGRALGAAGDKSRGGDDADSDGVTNLNEFRAGTNPLDANSTFRIAVFSYSASSNVVVWTTVSNRSYQLQQADSLAPSTLWQDLGPLNSGTGLLFTQYVVGPTSSAKYFRVRAQ